LALLILTWNIQWALGVDGRVNLERIAADTRRLGDADVVCFQEVSDGYPELKDNDGSNQFDLLASYFPLHERIDGAVLDVRAENGGRKRFGNLILSRYPVEQVLRYMLPWGTVPKAECMPRGLIEAVLRTPIGPLRMMTTHLEWSSRRLRTRQVEAIRDIHELSCRRTVAPPKVGKGTYAAQLASQSAILTGDFNMRPREATRDLLRQPLSAGEPPFVDAWDHLNPQIPHPPSMAVHDQSSNAPHCLDYVFVTADLAPRLRSITYDQSSCASDHQPVIVELN
jgi:endonuclease/exonuclease/phosphatase family metal-dependent hydrolase